MISQKKKFARKSADVEAIFLSSENIGEAAAWCGGTVSSSSRLDETYLYLSFESGGRSYQAEAHKYLVKDDSGVFSLWNEREFLETFAEAIPRQANIRQIVDSAGFPDNTPCTSGHPDGHSFSIWVPVNKDHMQYHGIGVGVVPQYLRICSRCSVVHYSKP